MNKQETLNQLDTGILIGLIAGIIIFIYNYVIVQQKSIINATIWAVAIFVAIYFILRNGIRRLIKIKRKNKK